MIAHPVPENKSIQQALRDRGGNWRRMAPDAITLTEPAMDVVQRAAKQIMAQHVPFETLHKITPNDAIALLGSHIFWEEESGKLFLCSELGRSRYCMDLSPEHWELRAEGGVQ